MPWPDAPRLTLTPANQGRCALPRCPLVLLSGCRLENDSETRASRLREPLQRFGRWPHLAPLDARDIGLRRLHPSSELRLRQPGRRTRLDQCTREVELFTEGVVRLLVVPVLARATMKLADLGHGFSSFALCSAKSISPVGVFSVFLMKALTMTTRCFFAVT